jgi:Family of unknown function (DUF6256)
MAPAGVLALSTADRQALIPMASGYLILMGAFGLGLYRLYRPRAAPSPKGPPAEGLSTKGPPADVPPAEGLPLAHGPATRPGPGQRTGRAALLRRIAGTVIGGYLLLMAVIVAYYYGVARVGPGFLESALSGTALLLGLAAPVFAALSWLAERRGRS